ncbi:MAG: RNA methyltransferase [Comamonadaceae bacterium]|nr:RNA methyltransferase [Comamonadaceae bacterium]
MHTRFVLIQTSHAGNVGAVARAMRTMGFDDLVLVAPRWPDVLQRPEAIERASGATDVLAKARTVATLEDALQGMHHVCATAMVARDFGPPTRSPRQHMAWLQQQLGQGLHGPAPYGVAFVFGSERYGMRNQDVYRCHVALQIPTAADFGSLNLAAAVQLIAYEWRLLLKGLGGDLALDAAPASDADQAAPAGARRADAQAVQAMLQHWQQGLQAIGYLDPAAPKKLMPRLQQLFNRADLREQEIHILRGIAKAMLEAAGQPRRRE